MIPMVMRCVVQEYDQSSGRFRGVSLWIPLFLVWILVLPLFLLVFLVWALLKIFALATAGSGPNRVVDIIEAAVSVLWKINGLRMDVRNRSNRFVLHF